MIRRSPLRVLSTVFILPLAALAAEARPFGDAHRPAPALADRAAWDALRLDRPQILRDADAEAGRPPPSWGRAEYEDYHISGSREAHGKPFRDRLHRAGLFTLAAGIGAKEVHIDAALREIEAILDEPTWMLPAHDSKDAANYHGRVVDIDLGVVMRAWTLATAGWVLEERMTPALADRLRSELHRRAIAPYLRRLDGDTNLCKWVHWQGNWNAVCHGGIIGAALYAGTGRAELDRILGGMRATIEKSFHGHAEDGYCSEGIMYHNYGFGHYVALAETLLRASDGRIDLFDTPRIRAIAAFPTRFEVFGQLFPAFADTPYGSRAQRDLQTVLAIRLGDPPLLPPALRQDRHPFGFTPGSLIYQTLLVAGMPDPAPITGETWSIRHEFPDGGVLISRPAEPGDTLLGAAFKGGHNAELHNHNDVGTFAIATGDAFPVTDVGSEVYTKDTFSGNRYTRVVNNSRGHNVPVIDGRLQREGRDAAARILRREFTPERDTWVLDLSACYDSPKVVRLEREFVHVRGAEPRVEVIDRFEFSEPATFGTALMTLGQWSLGEEGRLMFTHKSGTLQVEIHSTETYQVSEDRLEGQKLNYGLRATRVGVDLEAPVTRGELRMVFKPAKR